ncbi:hypothetical protein IWZ00DRAFT_260894 [Phyllosticta capitalensis]
MTGRTLTGNCLGHAMRTCRCFISTVSSCPSLAGNFSFFFSFSPPRAWLSFFWFSHFVGTVLLCVAACRWTHTPFPLDLVVSLFFLLFPIFLFLFPFPA